MDARHCLPSDNFTVTSFPCINVNDLHKFRAVIDADVNATPILRNKVNESRAAQYCQPCVNDEWACQWEMAGCPSAAFVHSFEQFLFPRYLMNG